ncbi:hypothetical protein MBLNU230_g0571t1 [Neophaeotheca triangularis]
MADTPDSPDMTPAQVKQEHDKMLFIPLTHTYDEAEEPVPEDPTPEDDPTPSTSAQENTKPKKKSIRKFRWDPSYDQHLLLIIYHICHREDIDIPWNEVASEIRPWMTGEAIKQHLVKLRAARAEAKLPVPPKTERRPRKIAHVKAPAPASHMAPTFVARPQDPSDLPGAVEKPRPSTSSVGSQLENGDLHSQHSSQDSASPGGPPMLDGANDEVPSRRSSQDSNLMGNRTRPPVFNPARASEQRSQGPGSRRSSVRGNTTAQAPTANAPTVNLPANTPTVRQQVNTPTINQQANAPNTNHPTKAPNPQPPTPHGPPPGLVTPTQAPDNINLLDSILVLADARALTSIHNIRNSNLARLSLDTDFGHLFHVFFDTRARYCHTVEYFMRKTKLHEQYRQNLGRALQLKKDQAMASRINMPPPAETRIVFAELGEERAFFAMDLGTAFLARGEDFGATRNFQNQASAAFGHLGQRLAGIEQRLLQRLSKIEHRLVSLVEVTSASRDEHSSTGQSQAHQAKGSENNPHEITGDSGAAAGGQSGGHPVKTDGGMQSGDGENAAMTDVGE